MREYRPQQSAVLFFGALCLVCFGVSAFVLQALFTLPQGPDLQPQLWLFAPVLLLFVGGAGLFLKFLLSTLAAYRIDPQGITRTVLGKPTRFLWQDVVDYRSGRMGQFGALWTLTDSDGRNMKIPVGMLERSEGLEGFLHAYTAPIWEQKRVQQRQTTQVYRYPKSLGIAMTVMSLFFLCFVAGAFAGSVAQPGPGWATVLPLCVLVFGGFGALAIGNALYYFTYTIRTTPDTITQSSLYKTRILAFHQVTAFYTGETLAQNGRTQRFTEVIDSEGRKIKFYPQLIDYDTLTTTLQSQMPPSVLTQGQQAKAVTTQNSRRQQAKITMVMGPLLVLLMVGMFATTGRDAFERLQRQNRLDKEGRPAQGTVTGRWSQSEGKSSTGYYINFEFQVDGKTYERTSPVSYSDYDDIPKNSPIAVTYVPADPTISRIPASIGRRKALGALAGDGIYALLVVPSGIFMFFRSWKTLRRENLLEGAGK